MPVEGPTRCTSKMTRGDLGVVAEADELVHEGDAGAARRREGPRAVPGGAQHHADGGEFIFRLHDAVFVLAGDLIHPQLFAVFLEGIHERGGRCDGIPGAHGGAGIDAAQTGQGVAIHHDVAGGLIHGLELQGQWAGEMLLGIGIAQLDGLEVAGHQFLLVGEGLFQELFDHGHVYIQQRREGPQVTDVLHEDAGADVLELLVHQLRQGHAEQGDVFPRQLLVPGPGGVIQEITAGAHFRQVLGVSLGVHGHHDVHPAGAGEITLAAHADLEPGGQALDVGGEEVLAHHGDAHAEDGLHEQAVGAGGTGAVDVRDLDDEVVYAGAKRP